MQKSIDTSVLTRYYRGSFWIKDLFKSKKQKSSQKTPHSIEKDRFFSQLPGLFLFCLASYRGSPFAKAKVLPAGVSSQKKKQDFFFCLASYAGGAAGYCLRVRKINDVTILHA